MVLFYKFYKKNKIGQPKKNSIWVFKTRFFVYLYNLSNNTLFLKSSFLNKIYN